jgi:hypothetical protein
MQGIRDAALYAPWTLMSVDYLADLLENVCRLGGQVFDQSTNS